MDFGYDDKTEEMRARLLSFMDEFVYPAEPLLDEQEAAGPRWTTPSIVEELHARLAESVPAESGAGVVHGDYRLDNVVVDADGRVAAVLDWEMATLGDPLADLGLLLVYWDGLARIGGNAVATAVNPAAGFPPGGALAARYAERRGADLTRLPWYTAFGFFKLAVIAEGIHYRFTQGKTVGAGFEQIGQIVPPLVAYGHATLSEEA